MSLPSPRHGAGAFASQHRVDSIENKAEEAFRRFDADGNGSLDLQEFTLAFKHGLGQAQKSGLITPDLKHAGVGMGLDRHGNAGRHTITVSSIVKDNSVFRDNRIRVGDRITHIDGQACEELPISETLEKIIGECGTEITFRVIHQNAQTPVEVTLQRGTPIYWHFMDIIDGLRDEAARLMRQPDDLLHAGVGITWDKKKDANAVVQAILKDGSAWRDGQIKVGDQVVAVDSKSVIGWSHDDLVNAIAGPYGTQVVLTWKKQGSNANVDVPLVRGSPVYWYFYDENAKLLERMREYEDREANLMRDWDAAMAQKDRDFQAALAALKKQLAEKESALAQKDRDFQAALAALKKQLAEKESALAQKDLDYQEALAALKKEHAEAISQMQKDHHDALLKQLQEHKEAMLKASQKHQKDMEDQVKMLQQQAEQHKKEMMQHSKGLADMASKHENEMRDQMKAHQDSLMQLKTENGKLREALSKAEQRASTAEANVVSVTNELQRAKDELDALARRLDKAESEAEAYRKEAQFESEKLRELQAEILVYRRDRKEMEAAQKDLKEAQAQAQSALDKVRDLQTEIVGYQRDRKELEAAKKAAKEAQADAESTREKLGVLEQENKQWARERKELEGQVQAAQDAAAKTAALNEKLKVECLELPELKSKLEMMRELEKGILASRRTIKDLEDLGAILKSENESLSAAVEISKADIKKLRAFKTEILSKYAATERNLQDQIFDLIDERNAYKSELDHFYSLPNPCGVGLGLKCTEMLDSKASSSVEVIDVQPGMAAGNSGVISIGDQVLEIDGMSAAGRTAEQMKSLISGKRGTRIRMTFRRTEDGTEYTVVLKRGAWGAEHCAVSPEHMDMVDEGRWPDVKSRFDADKSLTNGGTPFRGAY